MSINKISHKNVEPINFIFGVSDPGRKPFDFENKHPGVSVCVCGGGIRNLGLMIRDRGKSFECLQLLNGAS